MKKPVVSIATLGVMAAGLLCAQNRPETAPAATHGLKDAFAGKFLIGAAHDLRMLSEAELAHLKLHYNVLTPENCMKPQPLQPVENQFNWSTADALVAWCQTHGLKVWGHTLVWHAQTSRWFFEPGPDGQPVSRALAMERLKKHIQTVVRRYQGRIIGWDVVNEAINDMGAGNGENLRNSGWLRTIGPDYLTLAFKWAHEADPKAELYYNDYNIERGSLQNRGKHASSLLLLKRLKAEGAPIHGVGIQGHWSLNLNVEEVEKAIQNYAALGLKVSISELDVTASGDNSGAFPARGRGEPISDEAFKKQAEVYGRLFDVFVRQQKNISRVTFWGLSDRRSWRANQRPLLFDAQLQPKPAFHAVMEVAERSQVGPQKP